MTKLMTTYSTDANDNPFQSV